ncbi:hypothetical protein HN873_033242 [Arachis hypogaea]
MKLGFDFDIRREFGINIIDEQKVQLSKTSSQVNMEPEPPSQSITKMLPAMGRLSLQETG